MNHEPPPIPPSGDHHSIKGYRSYEHKQKFTTVALACGIVFILVQFLIPFVTMMIMVPSFFLIQNEWLTEADLDKGVLWNNEIWYTEQPLSSTLPERARLKKILLADTVTKELVAEIQMNRPWLLAGPDRLWIISSSSLAYVKDGAIQYKQDIEPLGDISHPFLYANRPALIESTPDGFALRTYHVHGWAKGKKIDWLEKDGHFNIRKDLQVVPGGNTVHVFMRYGRSIYYRKGLSPGDQGTRKDWQPITRHGLQWQGMMLFGDPTLFRLSNTRQGSFLMEGLQFRDGAWPVAFSQTMPLMSQMKIFDPGETDFFILLTQSFPGSLRLMECDHTGITSEIRLGSGFPFPPGMISMVLAPQLAALALPLLLTLILSVSMKKNRQTGFQHRSVRCTYASLLRRGWAQLIDGMIIFAPMIGAGFVYLPGAFDFEKMIGMDGFRGIGTIMGWIFIGFLWAFAWFLIYSFLEGATGRTPGKWLAKIRVVGIDLQPCGFFRALIRNFLEILDGFFGFMVGILVVALSENWQRIGDMAAKTLVIEDNR